MSSLSAMKIRRDARQKLVKTQSMLRSQICKTEKDVLQREIESLRSIINAEAAAEIDPEEMRSRREFLASNPGLQDIFEAVWMIFLPHTENGVLTKAGYSRFYQAINVALVGKKAFEDITEHPDLDWASDVRIFGQLNKTNFFDFLFETIEVYAGMVNPHYYAAFAWALLDSIGDTSLHPPKLRPLREIPCITKLDSEAKVVAAYLKDKKLRTAMSIETRFLARVPEVQLRLQGRREARELVGGQRDMVHVLSRKVRQGGAEDEEAEEEGESEEEEEGEKIGGGDSLTLSSHPHSEEEEEEAEGLPSSLPVSLAPLRSPTLPPKQRNTTRSFLEYLKARRESSVALNGGAAGLWVGSAAGAAAGAGAGTAAGAGAGAGAGGRGLGMGGMGEGGDGGKGGVGGGIGGGEERGRKFSVYVQNLQKIPPASPPAEPPPVYPPLSVALSSALSSSSSSLLATRRGSSWARRESALGAGVGGAAGGGLERGEGRGSVAGEEKGERRKEIVAGKEGGGASSLQVGGRRLTLQVGERGKEKGEERKRERGEGGEGEAERGERREESEKRGLEKRREKRVGEKRGETSSLLPLSASSSAPSLPLSLAEVSEQKGKGFDLSVSTTERSELKNELIRMKGETGERSPVSLLRKREVSSPYYLPYSSSSPTGEGRGRGRGQGRQGGLEGEAGGGSVGGGGLSPSLPLHMIGGAMGLGEFPFLQEARRRGAEEGGSPKRGKERGGGESPLAVPSLASFSVPLSVQVERREPAGREEGKGGEQGREEENASLPSARAISSLPLPYSLSLLVEKGGFHDPLSQERVESYEKGVERRLLLQQHAALLLPSSTLSLARDSEGEGESKGERGGGGRGGRFISLLPREKGRGKTPLPSLEPSLSAPLYFTDDLSEGGLRRERREKGRGDSPPPPFFSSPSLPYSTPSLGLSQSTPLLVSSLPLPSSGPSIPKKAIFSLSPATLPAKEPRPFLSPQPRASSLPAPAFPFTQPPSSFLPSPLRQASPPHHATRARSRNNNKHLLSPSPNPIALPSQREYLRIQGSFSCQETENQLRRSLHTHTLCGLNSAPWHERSFREAYLEPNREVLAGWRDKLALLKSAPLCPTNAFLASAKHQEQVKKQFLAYINAPTGHRKL